MKKSAVRKDIRRTILKSRNRFLSILAIIALSAGFFAGIKSTSPDMMATADAYYKESNLMDVKLISTIGFDKKDIQKIKKIPSVQAVTPGYTKDLFAGTGHIDYNVRVHAIPNEGSYSGNMLNKPTVVEGRMPKNKNECVVLQNVVQERGFPLGSKLKLVPATKDEKLKDTFAVTEFEIVGVVTSATYIHMDLGSTTIGDGTLNSIVYVPEDAFDMDAYTEVYLQMKGSENYTAYSDEYKTQVEIFQDKVKNGTVQILDERFDEAIEKNRKKLNDGQKKLDKAKKETYAELADAKAKLTRGDAELASGKQTLKTSKKQLQDGIKKGEAELKQNRKKLDESQKQLDSSKALLKQIENLIKNPPSISGGIPADVQQLINASKAFHKDLPTLLTAYLASPSATLYTQVDKVLNGVSSELKKGQKTIDNGYKALAKGEKELAKTKKEGPKEIKAAEAKIKKSEQTLAAGWAEYNDGVKKADSTFAVKQKDLDKAKKKLDDMAKDGPELYNFTRAGNNGYESYEQDGMKVDAIAKVFPVFFILVAALICFTTMTRMVEEERTQIGTMKALGYSKGQIAKKYLIYGAVASFIGSVIGLLIGFQLFPKIIYNAYTMMYLTPDILAPFRWDYAIACTAVALLVAIFAVLLASRKELMGTPAYLMRPKPPKSGKRVFLERVTFLWKRLNFTQKVTVRNIFRYKSRVILTIVGIAGCTGLMLAGFGIKDSISAVVKNQFGNVWLYDSTIITKENLSQKQLEDTVAKLESMQDVDTTLTMMQQNVTVLKNGKEKEATMSVPMRKDNLEKFVVLKDRLSGEKYTLQDNGIVLTEKLAKMLEVEVGDSVELDDGEFNRVTVKVTAITENYAYHYVYMSKELYKKVYKEDPEINCMFVNLGDHIKTEEEEKAFATKALEIEEIAGVGLSSQSFKSFSDMMGSLNYIVLVLVVCSGALAFVVLYNLTNINVAERVRELATIKVLGFYDREVTQYIYRENMICSTMGIIVGLFLGVLLHQFVIVTAEVDMVMFGRSIFPLSFLYASLLTLLFTFIVNIFLHFKLKKISMVESLKSVE